MGLFNFSQDNRALVGLSNVYSRLAGIKWKQYEVKTERGSNGEVTGYTVVPRDLPPIAVKIPGTAEELALACFKAIENLDDRVFDAVQRRADSQANFMRVARERDEALKRVKALEAELEEARESLRDKLAACALQPLLEAVPEANPYVQALTDGLRAAVAEEAYRVADAMLAQRAGIIDVEVKP